MTSSIISSLRFSSKKKIPIILQTEAAECSLACLAMIANYHGHELDIAAMRRRFSISLKGATLNDLIVAAQGIQLASRAVRLELEEISQLKTPCILHWDLSHFVVLVEADSKSITIHDPAVGKKKLSLKEVSNHFTGVALELNPVEDFTHIKDKSDLKLSNFWSSISGSKSILVQVFILSFLLQIFSLASPFYMQTAIDDVVVGGNGQLMILLSIGFTILLGINLVTSTLRSFILLRLGTQLSSQIGSNLFRHLIRLPLDFFEKRHIGDVVSRYGSSKRIFDFLTQGVISIAIDGVLMVGTLIMILIYSPLLSSIVIGALSIYALVRIISFSTLRQKIEESIIKGASESSIFMESIRGIQAIKLFGKEDRRQKFWENHFVESLNSNVVVSKFNIWFGTINSSIFGLENIAVIYLGINLILSGDMSLGMMLAFLAYKANFSARVLALIEQIINYFMLKLHMERLSDIILTTPEELNEQPRAERRRLKGKIELKNIGYRYSDAEPYVFRNLSITINPGDSVAIVGPSGCGKSTLLKIILGVMSPSEGEVFVDGKNIKQCDRKFLRQQIGSVMQDDILFAGSMEENISFFDPDVDKRQVQIAAFNAGVLKDIVNMPMGFSTLVGDMGNSISGGPKTDTN